MGLTQFQSFFFFFFFFSATNLPRVCCWLGPSRTTIGHRPFFLNQPIGNFRSEYEYDYEYEFSVLSTRTLKNVDLET